MPPPLTHHEIIGWVEPFTRRGRHVDLAASDRIARRLAFRPCAHEPPPAPGSGQPQAPVEPPWSEALVLENPREGLFRLTRTVTRSAGTQAALIAEGPEPGPLLARIEAVPPAAQFLDGPRWQAGLTQRVDAPAEAGAPSPLVLLRAELRLDGFVLALEMPTLRRHPADLVLTATGSDDYALPQDLLAVLGWRWSRLETFGGQWKATLDLRGHGAAAAADAQARLAELAAHLARTLAEPPARFHQRLQRARWAVALRWSVPLLVCVALVVGVILLPRAELAPDSVWRMLIFNVPPLLLVAIFCLRELPRIEIPTLPRAADGADWRRARR